jgi:uncharacterized protein YyaL (SSP411 family)
MSVLDGSPPSKESEVIDWYDWRTSAFALAQAENKPILLDLTAVWCHWCHVMDETSYSADRLADDRKRRRVTYGRSPIH